MIIELLKSKSDTTTNIDGEPCENKKDLSSNANAVSDRLNLHAPTLRHTKSLMLDWVDLFMETKLAPLGSVDITNSPSGADTCKETWRLRRVLRGFKLLRGFIDHWMEDSLINLFTGWLAWKCCVDCWDNVQFTYWLPQPQKLRRL